MKKMILSTLLALSSIALANTSRVVNVFYAEETGKFAVNFQTNSGDMGFYQTNKIILVSKDISNCKIGCLASIKAESSSSFSIFIKGEKTVTVFTNDGDNLLSSNAFQFTKQSGKEALVLSLDILKEDKRAVVK